MRQGPHVLGNVMLFAKHRSDPVAGVVEPEAIIYSTVSSKEIP